jgi:carboxyl-terminal processing protease
MSTKTPVFLTSLHKFMKKTQILLGSFFLGVILTTTSAFGQVKDQTATVDKFATLLNYIERMYVDSVDAEALTEKAIVSLLEELDPHSVYLSKEELQEANEPLQGSFEGIGIQFQILNDSILVVNPIEGGPSEKLGIRAGDKIVEIEGKNVAGNGVTNNDVTSSLRGPKGTIVKIGIWRKGVKDILHYEIVRDKIPIFSIDASYMANPTTGYIKVSRFAKTTTEELRKALDDLKAKGMKDLILDLQGNGGGLLNSAIEMADEFISGDRLLVYTEGRSFARENFKANPKIAGKFEKGKLVVLIDESSASASEIVSGAVQDWDRGLIVGRRSFGKGLVQRPIPLPDGSAVRLTVQKYFTPAGRCIQKPYEDGLEAYMMDKKNRFEKGEFFSLDSLSFPDSLKFFTNIKKRTVYGGGGILPDIFVPLDTTESSAYFSELLRTGVNNDWVLNYVDAEREKLMKAYPTLDSFVQYYEVPTSGIQAMIDELEKKGVPFNKEEFAISERAIRIRTKALVARNLFDYSAFYRVINELNPAFKKALQTLEDGTFEKSKLAHSDFK